MLLTEINRVVCVFVIVRLGFGVAARRSRICTVSLVEVNRCIVKLELRELRGLVPRSVRLFHVVSWADVVGVIGSLVHVVRGVVLGHLIVRGRMRAIYMTRSQS